MRKEIHPKTQKSIESWLDSCGAIFKARCHVLFANKANLYVGAFAQYLYFLTPEVIKEIKQSRNEDIILSGYSRELAEAILQVILEATHHNDLAFFKQLAVAMEIISNLDKLLEESSDNQLTIVEACQELRNQNKDINLGNVWETLMEPPFNWVKKLDIQKPESLRAQIRKDLVRLELL